ncbi:zf-HC2 domain-containing protein [bacterium]|nr:zf-HC2 domain-containing protein [bacterium]
MDCAQWDLNAYHDGELEPELRSSLEQHLRDCSACQAVLHELLRLDELVRGEGPPALCWPAPRRRVAPMWLKAAVVMLCLLGAFLGLRPRPVVVAAGGYQVVHGHRVYQVEARGSGTVLLEMEVEDEFGKGRVQF